MCLFPTEVRSSHLCVIVSTWCSKVDNKSPRERGPPKPPAVAAALAAAAATAVSTPPHSGRLDDHGHDQGTHVTLNSASTMFTAIEDNGFSDDVSIASVYATPKSTHPSSASSQYHAKASTKTPENRRPSDETSPEAASSDDNSDGMMEVEYVMNPKFPDMPSSVPLTYTLAMHACLSTALSERPTFAQVHTSSPAQFRLFSLQGEVQLTLVCYECDLVTMCFSVELKCACVVWVCTRSQLFVSAQQFRMSTLQTPSPICRS